MLHCKNCLPHGTRIAYMKSTAMMRRPTSGEPSPPLIIF